MKPLKLGMAIASQLIPILLGWFQRRSRVSSPAMEISPLRERVSKLESRLEILRGHL